MKKSLIVLLSCLVLVFFYNIAYALPLNDKIIQYRYYVKQTSLFPEFQNDFVLNLEKRLSLMALENEINKSVSDYEEVLNYIETKNSSEILIYAEFLKGLKEKLASIGIFSQKFDNIVLANTTFNDKFSDDYSLEFKAYKNFNQDLPEAVKITKRVFPYLLNQSQNDKNKVNRLFKAFLDDINKSKGDPTQDAYKKAIAFTNNAYIEYCNNNFETSAKAFEDSIPYWEIYYNLSGNSDLIPQLKGILKIYQGNSAVEYNYNAAKKLYESAIAFFPNDISSKMSIYWANCSIAEIYYRQNDIKGFINWMKSHPAFKDDQDVDDANDAIVLKTSVIQYEYNRLSQQTYTWNNSTTGKKERKNIMDLIKKIDGNTQNTPTNNYVKKFSNRYKSIMESNLLEIREITIFTSNDIPAPAITNKTNEKIHITLKNHKEGTLSGEIIVGPDWLITANGNNMVIKTNKVAVARNRKIILQVKFNSPIPSNFNIYGESSWGGYFKMIEILPDKSTAIFESQSLTANQVGIVENIFISWTINNTKIIQTFFSKIYIVREYIAEPCYWQIIEYTCKWLENLSPLQLDNEQAVIDAIWNGCNKENLAKMGYKYVYDQENNSPNNINELLCKLNSSCGGWTEFLIHCFYTQGIYNSLNDNGTVKIAKVFNVLIKTLDYYTPTGKDKVFRNKENILSIGNTQPSDYYQDHNFIAIGGEYQEFYIDNKLVYYDYIGGEIFDIVYGIRIKNDSYLSYENKTIGYIKKNRLDNVEIPKNQSERQFVIKCAIVKSLTLPDGQKINYPYFPTSEIK